MEITNLTDQFLIAMPSLSDPNFNRTVTYICSHSEEGTMGITINRPTDMNLGQIFKQMDLEIQNPALGKTTVFNGGPVQIDRGFILHDQGREWDSTLAINDKISLTTSKDVLEAIANGQGPDNFFIALGYAGWSPGQLEDELLQNAWLNGPADFNIIFNTKVEHRWQSAALHLGIEIDQISNDIGHA